MKRPGRTWVGYAGPNSGALSSPECRVNRVKPKENMKDGKLA